MGEDALGDVYQLRNAKARSNEPGRGFCGLVAAAPLQNDRRGGGVVAIEVDSDRVAEEP